MASIRYNISVLFTIIIATRKKKWNLHNFIGLHHLISSYKQLAICLAQLYYDV